MDRVHLTAGSSREARSCQYMSPCPGYDIDLNRAVDLVQKSNAKLVGIQAPEGLKRATVAIAERIAKETGAEVIISGDPCYGACDVDLKLCEDVDLLLHLGHAELDDNQEKVVFLEARMQDDIGPAVEKAALLFRTKRVGVTTTIQHVHKLAQIIEVLQKHGIEGVLGPAGGRVKHAGQVLGCCYRSAKALDLDEYLFIGTGQFHPLGIALATGKRVISADPVTSDAKEIDPEPMIRRRFGAIARAMQAKRFAILVSKKQGQKRMDLAKHIKKLGEAKGKEMHLILLDNIEPDRLINLGIEAAVSTACPRVALDDAAKYRIPILTPQEFEVLVGEKTWDRYAFDEMG